MQTNVSSVGELAKALRNAQRELESVKKEKQGYGYKYADLSACLEAIREPLYKNGLSISQLPKIVDGKQILVTQLMHDSGESLIGEYLLEGLTKTGMNACQAMGSALTYARRYSLAAMIGLAQEDDDAASTGKATNINVQDNALNRLKELCLQEDINVNAFAKYFGLSRSNMGKINQAVDGFPRMAEVFKKVMEDETAQAAVA